MSKNVTLFLSVLLRCVLLCIILLLGILVFQWTISPALAQGGLLGNPSFETGSLPPWVKWGYPRSTVMTLNCCSYGGSWSAWIVPDGRYVELQQNVSVTPRRTYRLEASAYTNGLNAQIAWWSNATNSTVCASVNSTSYVRKICELNVPDGTTAFNVHLGANSPQGSGQWAITDDWYLTLKTFEGTYGQAFPEFPVANSQGVKANIWTAQQPGGYSFIASPVFVCTNFPCQGFVGFAETGYNMGTNTNPPNVLQQYVSWGVLGGTEGGEFGKGNLNNNTWYNMGVEYDSSLGRWVAFRGGTRVFTFSNLNFQSGAVVGCGAEGSNYTTPINVQCDTTQYRVVGQNWTSYNYNNVQINGNYCVYKSSEFGSVGWGPCY